MDAATNAAISVGANMLLPGSGAILGSVLGGSSGGLGGMFGSGGGGSKADSSTNSPMYTGAFLPVQFGKSDWLVYAAIGIIIFLIFRKKR